MIENKQPENKDDRVFEHNGIEYEVPTQHGFTVSHVISQMWEKLGKPDTPLSKQGAKLMDIIIATWEDTFPDHYREWVRERQEVISSQKTTKEQVKEKTGRSLAAYPMYVYKMIKLVFPTFRFTDRENQIKLVKKWPIFKLVEKE